MDITSRPFGITRDGQAVTCYTLRNDAGMAVEVLNWGCVIRSILVPDRDGNPTDVVLGYESIDRYLNNGGERFLGAALGRYANRIARGRKPQRRGAPDTRGRTRDECLFFHEIPVFRAKIRNLCVSLHKFPTK